MTSPQVEVVGELIECSTLLKWSSLAGAHTLSLARLARGAGAALQAAPHRARATLAYRLLLALAEPLVLDDGETYTTYHLNKYILRLTPFSPSYRTF